MSAIVNSADFLQLKGSTAAVWLVGIGLSLAITFAADSKGLQKWLRSFAVSSVSVVLNAFLLWKYPIWNIDRTKSLPSLPYIWPNGTGDAAKFLDGRQNGEKWLKEYGQIYRIWNGMTSEVIISQPEHLKELFKDSDQHTKAVNNDSGYLMSQILGQCVGLLSRMSWRRVRQKMEVPFTHQAVADSAWTIRNETRKYVKQLVDKEEFKAGTFDPAKDMKFYPFLTTATIMYGELDDDSIQELRRLAPLREHLFTYVIKGGLSRFSVSRYLPTAANKFLKEFQDGWLRWNEEMYRKKKEKGEKTPMVTLWEDCLNGNLDRVQLLQTLDESLFANLDVTTSAISWNFVYLAANTKDQMRLAEEIKELASGGDEAWNAYIARSDTFLAACINESSRLRPVIPFSIPQAPPTDRRVGEWIIPKDTMLIIDAYSLNIRNEFWGDEREKYNPSRFLGVNPSQLRYQMWRFGFGPRQCMGKFLADRMLRSIVATILKDFVLELPEAETDKDFTVNPREWTTQANVKLRCLPRV